MTKNYGLIIRSRAEWREKGEKSTSYFFNLEKHNITCKNIRKLYVDGKEEVNQKKITKAIYEYYKKIYETKNTNISITV